MRPTAANPQEIIDGNIEVGSWPAGCTSEKSDQGTVVTFPNGRRRLILSQRELNARYKSTRKWPAIMHGRVETIGDAY